MVRVDGYDVGGVHLSQTAVSDENREFLSDPDHLLSRAGPRHYRLGHLHAVRSNKQTPDSTPCALGYTLSLLLPNQARVGGPLSERERERERERGCARSASRLSLAR